MSDFYEILYSELPCIAKKNDINHIIIGQIIFETPIIDKLYFLGFSVTTPA